jgi:hypothetical protein
VPDTTCGSNLLGCLQGVLGLYHCPMCRFFDIADHDRLPQRFAGLDRSVLARL